MILLHTSLRCCNNSKCCSYYCSSVSHLCITNLYFNELSCIFNGFDAVGNLWGSWASRLNRDRSKLGDDHVGSTAVSQGCDALARVSLRTAQSCSLPLMHCNAFVHHVSVCVCVLMVFILFVYR